MYCPNKLVVLVLALLAQVHEGVRPADNSAVAERVEVKVHAQEKNSQSLSEDPPGEKEYKALSKTIQSAKQPLNSATKQGLKTIEDGKTWAATKARADDHIDTLRKTVIKAQEYYRDENQKFEQRNTQLVQDVLAEHASTIEGYDNKAYEDVDDDEPEPEVLPRAADTTPAPQQGSIIEQRVNDEGSLLSKSTNEHGEGQGGGSGDQDQPTDKAHQGEEHEPNPHDGETIEEGKVDDPAQAAGLADLKKASGKKAATIAPESKPEEKTMANKVMDFFR